MGETIEAAWEFLHTAPVHSGGCTDGPVDAATVGAPDADGNGTPGDDAEEVDVVEVAVACEQVIAYLHARQLQALVALSAQADLGADDQGVVIDPTAPEVACALHWTPAAAGDRVGLALEVADLPAVMQALADGLIDLARAREIVDGSWGLDPDARQGLSTLAVAFATTHTRGQLRAWLARAVHRIDPDAAAARRKTAKRTRGVRLRPDHDGMATLTATLTAEEAVACMEAIRARANSIDGGRDANQADVLVELLTGIAAGAQIPVTVLITADGVELPGYGPVSADLAAELLGAHTTTDTEHPDTTEPVEDTDTTDTDLEPETTYQQPLVPDLPDEDTPADTDPAQVEQVAVDGPHGHHREDLADEPEPSPPDQAEPPAAARPQDDHVRPQAQPEPTPPPPDPARPPAESRPPAGSRPPAAARTQPSTAGDPARPATARPSCRIVKVLNTATAPPPVTGYRPSTRIARHVRARDRHCRFPGCRHPATTCDIDHTIAYPHGPTDPANLHCLCRRHHRLKTHTAWTVHTLPGDILQWTSPRGRTYLALPDDP